MNNKEKLYSIVIFQEETQAYRQGINSPYMLALNEDSAFIFIGDKNNNDDFKFMEKEALKSSPNKEIIQKIIDKYEFKPIEPKNGDVFNNCPLIQLIHSSYPPDTPLDKNNCLEYKQEYFTTGELMYAGGGNFGVCLGNLKLLNIKNNE